MSSQEDQTALITQRLDALSRSPSLTTLKSTLTNDVNYIATEVNTQLSTALSRNREQILTAVEDLTSKIQLNLGGDILSMFASFSDSIQDGDFESLDITNWVTTTLKLFETHFGSLAMDQDRLLEIVNEFTSIWNNKVEGLRASNKYLNLPPQSARQDENASRGRDSSRDSRDINDIQSSSARTEGRDVSKSRASEGRSPSTSDKRGGLFSKMAGLFKAERSQSNAEGPRVINLGNDKNFRWDEKKKRYVFEDEDEEEEEQEDSGPPLMKFASESAIKQVNKPEESHSLVKPPGHRGLAKKKTGGKGPGEAKRPAFIPSAPALDREEHKEHRHGTMGSRDRGYEGFDVLETIKRRIEEIYEQADSEEIVIKGIGKLKRNLKALDEVSGSRINEEMTREAKFLVMESELESTQISIVRESYSRKLLESELTSLRESYQVSMEKELELSENVRELERDLSMYRDVQSLKSLVSNTKNSSQMQQKMLENFLQNLKETNVEKKKLIEANNQLRETELQLQEVKSAYKVMQAKYEQVLEHQKGGNSSSTQLKGLLEDSYKAQNDQDKMIIQMKEENLGLVVKCRELCEEIGRLKGERNGLDAQLSDVEGRYRELEDRYGELEGTHGDLGGRHSDLEGTYEDLQGRYGDLEGRYGELEGTYRDMEERYGDLEGRYRELEERYGDLERRYGEAEEGWNQARNQIEEHEGEQERLRSEIEEYNERVQSLSAEKEDVERRLQETVEDYEMKMRELGDEKEDVVRRLEESIEEGRRLKINVDDLDRELKTALEQKDQTEREVRREREQMLEELLEHKSKTQMTAQEKDLLSKFSEEITESNLALEEKIHTLNTEVSKLNTEKHKSTEAILEFIRDTKTVLADAGDFQSLEAYVAGLLETHVDVSEHYFRAVGVLPKIRDCIIRELDAEKTRKNLEIENLSMQWTNMEREKVLAEEQQRLLMEECQRLGGIIEANTQQNELTEQKFQEMAGEIERLKGEIEWYTQQNLQLERGLQQKEIESGENLRALEQNQQYQHVALQEFEGQIRQLADLREEMFKIQAGLEDEKVRGLQANLMKAELEEQINTLKEENSEMQQQIDEGFEQYTFLQNKVKELLEKLKQSKEENTHLKSHHEELEQNNRKISSQLELQATTESSIIQQQATTIETLEAEKASLTQEIAALRDRVDILAQELQNNAGASNTSDVQALNERIDALTRELESKQGVPHEVVAGLNERIEQLTQELQGKEAATGDVGALNERIESLTRELESQQGVPHEVVAGLNERIEQLTQEIQTKEAAATGDVGVLNARIEQLTQEIQNKERAVANDMTVLSEKNELLKSELMKRETEIAGLLDKASVQERAVADEKTVLTEKNELLKSELLKRDTQIAELLDRVNILQSGKGEEVQQLSTRLDDMSRLIEERDNIIRELEANIKAISDEREQVLGTVQTLQTERDEAMASVKAAQTGGVEEQGRFEMLRLERDELLARLQAEETRTYSLGAVLEEKENIETLQKEMEGRVQALEEHNARLSEEKDGAVKERDDLRREVRELNNIIAQRNAEQGSSGVQVDGEELWSEIEKEYGGSRVLEYLQAMKAKLGVEQKEISGVKLIGVLLKEFEEALGDISRGLEEKESTVIGLTRSLDDMNEQYQKLQNQMAMLEGEQSGKEDYSSIRELYEKKTKRVEELLKEVTSKSQQIEQMKKTMDEQAKELEDRGQKKGEEGEVSSKEELTSLRQEVEKEKERANKAVEEFENYKKKQKNTSEERGAIQHSYTQIIKNLSIQLDEVKKKKGLPTATLVTKGTQTGEEEKKPATSPAEDNQKRQGFLSGMAKFFLTEAEAKKI